MEIPNKYIELKTKDFLEVLKFAKSDLYKYAIEVTKNGLFASPDGNKIMFINIEPTIYEKLGTGITGDYSVWLPIHIDLPKLKDGDKMTFKIFEEVNEMEIVQYGNKFGDVKVTTISLDWEYRNASLQRALERKFS
jgi:hypothetical protein